jgi:hypothetical protein
MWGGFQDTQVALVELNGNFHLLDSAGVVREQIRPRRVGYHRTPLLTIPQRTCSGSGGANAPLSLRGGCVTISFL